MNGRRGPEREREPSPPAARGLLQTSWFRVVVVFAVLGAVALVAVPWSLRLAARTAGDRAPAERSGGAATDRADTAPRIEVSSAAAGHVLPVRAAVVARVPAALAGTASPAAPGTAGEAGPMLAQAPAPAQSPAPAPKTGAAKSAPARDTRSVAESGAPYWVQVGAFRDPQTAKRVAQQLREANFRVQESTVTRPTGSAAAPAGSATPAAPAGERASAPATSGAERPAASDRYEVVVIGTASELEAKLAAKGLATRAAADGVVVTPTLALNEAVDLSKQLTTDGLTVRVRRVAATATPGAPARAAGAGAPPAGATATATGAGAPTAGATPTATGAAPAGGGETLHRVRVGEFADRAAAMAALQQLEARGFKPFIARGGQ